MREVQTEPRVDVGYRMSAGAYGFLDITVCNIGQGPAYNIAFHIEQIEGDEAAAGLTEELGELGFVRRGLRYLSPGQEVSTFFTSMFERFDAKVASQVAITVGYANVLGKRYEERFVLDLSELKGMSRIGTPPMQAITKSIDELGKKLASISSHGRLRVDVWTADDREAEESQRRANIESARAGVDQQSDSRT
ncbi:hypothetical protein [Halovibrio salipaludis]|nr:hypothetical protein [Halovibrio salipaludis]